MKTNPSQNQIYTIERSLIAALLVFERAADEVIPDLYPSHFANEKFGKIFDAMRALVNDGVGLNPTTVGKRLRDRRHKDIEATEDYLHELWGSSATAVDAKWCADEIRKAWQTRDAARVCGEAVLSLNKDGADHEKIIDRLQGQLENVIKASRLSGPSPMGQDVQNSYATSREASASGGVGGTSSGFSRLDWWTSGFQKSNLVVLAAQTGMGKTSLAMNIASNVAKADKGVVVIFSMEMGRSELASRLVASEASLDLRKMAVGNLGEADWGKYEAAQQALTPMADRLLLDVSGRVTPESIRASLRQIQRRHEVALVIVDYLQLCGTEGRTGSQYERISRISGDLKGAAIDFDVPVLALSQLSREAARRNGEPQLSDLRDSGSIEQDANVVIFIQRKKEKKITENNGEDATIIIAKNRNGPTGKFTMRWTPHHVRFSDTKSGMNSHRGEYH